ncbi:hypothetical protein PUG46_11265 [Erwiniaceae bacterium L1_55_4]|nr:hypothetical protein [Erwiniaceae bacterium L1_55_4]
MMLLSLTAVAQAGSYGAMTLREMYRLADSGDATMNEVLHGLGGVNALIG